MIERDPLYFRLFSFVFWLSACWGFATQELLPFLSPLGSAVSLLCDAIMVLLGILTLSKSKRDRVFLWIFLLIAIASTIIINKSSAINLFNGTRDFIGILFAIPVMRYFIFTARRRVEFKAKIDHSLFIFLCIQAFCITWQFIRYGANDHGGGSMGNNYSGIVSMLIYLISFYLISQKWDRDNYWQSLKDNKLYVILLYPTMLNETKSSFILLALYFALLYRFELKKLGKLVMLIPVIAIVFAGVAYAYFSATKQEANEVGSQAFIMDYLIGDDREMLIDLAIKVQDEEIETDNLWVVDIPRFLKIITLPEIMTETRGGMTYGAGLGQFKGGTNVAVTHFAKANKWIVQGTRPWLFYLIVEFGLLGTVWFFINFFSIIALKKRPYELSYVTKIYLLLIAFMILFYDDAFRSLIFCIGFFYVALASCYDGEAENEKEITDGER